MWKLVAVAIVVLVLAASGTFLWWETYGATLRADPDNSTQVAMGRSVYADHCASCHGVNLEGEPNWQSRKVNGRLPAPPHDASGHTWHHADTQLFEIIKNGIELYAPAGYQSDMRPFRDVLRDEEIWSVLAYIKSSWPDDIRQRQSAITAQVEK